MHVCDVASIGSAASAGWNLSALHSSFFDQLIGVFHRQASVRRLMVSRSDSMHRLGDYCASLLQRLMCLPFCALMCPVKCSERIWHRLFYAKACRSGNLPFVTSYSGCRSAPPTEVTCLESCMKNKVQFMGVEEQTSKEYLFQMYHRGQSQRLV